MDSSATASRLLVEPRVNARLLIIRVRVHAGDAAFIRHSALMALISIGPHIDRTKALHSCLRARIVQLRQRAIQLCQRWEEMTSLPPARPLSPLPLLPPSLLPSLALLRRQLASNIAHLSSKQISQGKCLGKHASTLDHACMMHSMIPIVGALCAIVHASYDSLGSSPRTSVLQL